MNAEKFMKLSNLPTKLFWKLYRKLNTYSEIAIHQFVLHNVMFLVKRENLENVNV